MRIILVLSCGLALAACGKSEADGRVEFIAAGINAIAPKSLGGGLTMRKAVPNGSRLTLSIDGASTHDLELPDFDSQIRAAVCQDQGFRKVIAEGVDVTMELTANSGRNAKVEVTSC